MKGLPDGFEVVELPEGYEVDESATRRQSWKRGFGLGARQLIEGALAIPKIGANALTGAANLGLATANLASGGRVPYRIPYQGDNVSDLLGLPAPETEGERRVDAAGRMIYGTLGSLGLGRLLAGVPGLPQGSQFTGAPPGTTPPTAAEKAGSMVPEAGRILARNPVQQMTASVVGPLAGEGARQAGAGPVVQTGVEIGAQMLVPGDDAIMSMAERVKREGVRGAGRNTPLAAAAGGAKRRASGVFEPFTPEGRERAVGRVLYESASDPDGAVARMAAAPKLVPGSAPTAGQAAGDVGLLSLENSLDTPLFDPRKSLAIRRLDQNAAQRAALERIGGRPGMADRIAELRDKWASAKVPQVFGEARDMGLGTSPLDAIDQQIASTLKRPIGDREPVQKALDYIQGRLDTIRDDGQSIVDSERLYSIRQDVAQALEGRLRGAQARDASAIDPDTFRAARSQVVEVLRKMDEAIEAGAPGFQAYMQRYARMSRAGEGASVLGTIRERALSSSATDPRTAEPLIQTAGLARAAASLSSEAGRALPRFQQDMLERIEQDMRRGAAGQSAAVRGPGSDTFQKIGGNITVANIIGRALGQGVGQDQKLTPVINRFRWLLETPEEETKALLVRAMLDPELASKLLKQASEESVKEAAEALQRKAALGGLAGQATVQGGLLSQQPPKPEQP